MPSTISPKINGTHHRIDVSPGELLRTTLRRLRIFSVKHGDETGESGADAIIFTRTPDAPKSYRLVNSGILLASQADGASVITLEGLDEEDGEGAERSRVESLSPRLSALQQQFIDCGAIQCGYCTPAQILAAQHLLDSDPRPGEAAVREAIAGVLCRCTGYVKPVQAILRAAAQLQGETPPPPVIDVRDAPATGEWPATDQPPANGWHDGGPDTETQTRSVPVTVAPPRTQVVNKPERKVDAVKLAKGRPVFADDVERPGMLYGGLLTSPVAHARILSIDTSDALALPGVHAVQTYADLPRVIYASGGQSYPQPPPYDQVSLDSKVRYVGDRVATVAAETPELVQEALERIKVEYEELPAVFSPEEATQAGAPVIHDETDAQMIHDAKSNVAVKLLVDHNDVDAALESAHFVFESEYRVHQVQQASIEPHIVITYWDEDDRLVIRTSTQVPFHVRRMVAPLLGLPVRRIRVVKPRIGGGFGGKQEMLIEDLCAHLTIATGRPVKFEYTRQQEFTSARTRHPQRLRFRSGVDASGKLVGMEVRVLADTGAYGTHGLTVQMVTGFRALSTYWLPAARFDCDVVYTNKPVPGAFRGYGAPQALFGLEQHMEEMALAFGIDPVEFKRINWVKEGQTLPMAVAMGEGREGFPQTVESSGLAECVEAGAASIGWDRRHDASWKKPPDRPHVRRGIGLAICMHGTGIAGLDMGAASIKLNDDGSFNLLVGATDLGTGSDTVLAQIAAEALGVPLEQIVIYSSDTDFTPFDTGAYASSTTYISGGAVLKAAEDVGLQIRRHAAAHLFQGLDAGQLWLEDQKVLAPDGRAVTLEKVALHSIHQEEQHQIMATASHMSYVSPPPFAAQYAALEVDTETGQVTVEKAVMAVDCGIAINPVTASGQVEGGMTQALGYALCEEMPYDDRGKLEIGRFGDYRILAAHEMPELDTILVQTYEPTGPFGAKAIAEIPIDGMAPAIASAIFDATGVRIREIPYTPERVWRALRREEK
ncbi:MAG: molybdopterin-dependent oxidoreductase [Caldilineaceae bacterium SB0670_bin_27]|uniref:Molybdopterin-dependent oxidoreductase n=1 Tax=Caldilineaceae bacterium SB0664_bin_27 TaxID=2605260 RepID=A0A6B0YN88_9CHLR|nr:molybdopterin-dependent oxidoreductase [Caldilineaceae bacterium SB0664_bin_27]MYJ77221.1 molybdopterin-dependent oxidoreductase [Caldilineaceae bacterium SB0670_bin_27]